MGYNKNVTNYFQKIYRQINLAAASKNAKVGILYSYGVTTDESHKESRNL